MVSVPSGNNWVMFRMVVIRGQEFKYVYDEVLVNFDIEFLSMRALYLFPRRSKGSRILMSLEYRFSKKIVILW